MIGYVYGRERTSRDQTNNDCDKPTNTRRSVQEKANPQLLASILHAQKKDEMKITRKKDLQIRALRSWRPREKGKHRQMSDPTGTQIARSLAR